MAKDGSVDLQELTKLAADIAKTAPEELRAAAFNKVFDALLAQRGAVGTPAPREQQHSGSQFEDRPLTNSCQAGSRRRAASGSGPYCPPRGRGHTDGT